MSHQSFQVEEPLAGMPLTPRVIDAITELRKNNVEKIRDDLVEIVFYVAGEGWAPDRMYPGLFDLYEFLSALATEFPSLDPESRG
ncbi:MAG TPA: hypothetical protein PKN44_10090 [Bacteroidales bacterium]|nr:hypothetical protein [Bacteroidales bacterium]